MDRRSATLPHPGQIHHEARERVRTRSKLMFGNRDRLEVATAIALGDGLANATDLSWELKLANNRVRAQLLVFTDLAMLQPAPLAAGKRMFVRLDSALWALHLTAYEQVLGAAPS